MRLRRVMRSAQHATALEPVEVTADSDACTDFGANPGGAIEVAGQVRGSVTLLPPSRGRIYYCAAVFMQRRRSAARRMRVPWSALLGRAL